MDLDPSLMREFAFTGNISALEGCINEVRKVEPDKAYASDSLEIVMEVARSNFTKAEALIDALRLKYEKTQLREFIAQITGLYEIYIDFNYGRFDSVHVKSKAILSITPENFGLEPMDRLQPMDQLILLKICAETAFLKDDYESVQQIALEAEDLKYSGENIQALYFLNTIRTLNIFQQGDFRDTLLLAEKTIEIGKRAGYQGIANDFAVRNIRYRCLIAMAEFDEAQKVASHLLEITKMVNSWPWFFVTNNNIIKALAQENKIKESLHMVREVRELITSFKFKNELVLFADAAELYVRYLLEDEERVNVLMKRLPDLLLSRQIKSGRETSHLTQGLKAIHLLPEKNQREKLYKTISYCEFYKSQESQALKYARQALEITEKTGYLQFLLLQNQLHSVLLKACDINPTAFTEEFSRRLTAHIKSYDEQRRGVLVVPLTSRELEVVQHLATGKPISQIAATLHVSMNTMKTHLRNTYRKLEVDGRDGAVNKAKELFLI